MKLRQDALSASVGTHLALCTVCLDSRGLSYSKFRLSLYSTVVYGFDLSEYALAHLLIYYSSAVGR